MNKKRIRLIFDKLQPYINGKLITSVFERYWNELKEEVFK